MALRLLGKVTLITGGARGIGRATAQLFAKEGAKVVVDDINDEGGAATVRDIQKGGGKAIYVRGDVSNIKEVRSLVDTTVKNYGRLDILVNNAAIDHGAVLHETSEEDYDRVMNINLKGVFFCTKYALLQMLKQGSGNIIFVASQVAFNVGYGFAAYTATKAALVSLAKNVAWAYGSKNIRANALCPGPTDTPMQHYAVSFRGKQHANKFIRKTKLRTPLHRWARPEEIANCALFLASEESAFMTGASLVVDGGETAGIVTYQPPDFEEVYGE